MRPNEGKTNSAMNARSFCFNQGPRKTVSLQRKFLVGRLNSVKFNVGKFKQCGILATKTYGRGARMPHQKQQRRSRKSKPRSASCASASLQRGKDFPMVSKRRSVEDAVPGREDVKDAVTQDEMLPPRVNGSMQKKWTHGA